MTARSTATSSGTCSPASRSRARSDARRCSTAGWTRARAAGSCCRPCPAARRSPSSNSIRQALRQGALARALLGPGAPDAEDSGPAAAGRGGRRSDGLCTRARCGFSAPAPRNGPRSALAIFGPETLARMAREDHGAEVTCEFCRTQHTFSRGDLERIRRPRSAQLSGAQLYRGPVTGRAAARGPWDILMAHRRRRLMMRIPDGYLSRCLLPGRLRSRPRQPQVAPDAPAAADAARVAELSEKARAIVDAYTNNEPPSLADGKKVVFVSNRDGLPQLYLAELDQPAAAPARLTRTSERVTGPLPLPDGQSILYRSDRGADENWSIFKIGLDGEEPVELTPGRKAAAGWAAGAARRCPTRCSSRRARWPSQPARSTPRASPPAAKPRRVYGENSAGILARRLSRRQAGPLAPLPLVQRELRAARRPAVGCCPRAPPGGRAEGARDLRLPSVPTANGSSSAATSGGTQNVVLAFDPAAARRSPVTSRSGPRPGSSWGSAPRRRAIDSPPWSPRATTTSCAC